MEFPVARSAVRCCRRCCSDSKVGLRSRPFHSARAALAAPASSSKAATKAPASTSSATTSSAGCKLKKRSRNVCLETFLMPLVKSSYSLPILLQSTRTHKTLSLLRLLPTLNQDTLFPTHLPSPRATRPTRPIRPHRPLHLALLAKRQSVHPSRERHHSRAMDQRDFQDFLLVFQRCSTRRQTARYSDFVPCS